SAFCSHLLPPLRPTLLPYTTLFRSPYSRWVTSSFMGRTDYAPDRFTGRTDYAPDRCAGTYVISLRHSQIHDHVLEKRRLMTYVRSEEHTSELQSRVDLVCRLLLEKQ